MCLPGIHFGNPTAIYIEIRSNSGLNFTPHYTKMDVYSVLEGERVAR